MDLIQDRDAPKCTGFMCNSLCTGSVLHMGHQHILIQDINEVIESNLSFAEKLDRVIKEVDELG